MSELMKLDTDSLNVIVTSNVEDATGLEALEVIATVGPVPSYVQAKVLDAVLLLLAPSVNPPASTKIEVAPSVVGVKVAV